MEGSLKHAIFAPKHDPVPLAALMAAHYSRLGVVATMSTSFYPPFMLARLWRRSTASAQGRLGWNIVTSSEDRAAQNFGMERLPTTTIATNGPMSIVDVVEALWGSWDARRGGARS